MAEREEIVNMSSDVTGLPAFDDDDMANLGLLSADNDAYYYSGDINKLLHPWTKEPYFVPTISVYSVTFMLGMIGNSLVIFAMLGDRKSRSVTASFMVSLAVADLLFLIVCVPYETARFFITQWTNDVIFCKLSGAVEMLSALASVLNLMAVSIERYIVIVHPMKARSWCTVENTRKVLPCVWVIALAFSAPTLYVWDLEASVFYKNETTVTVTMCADIGISHIHRLVYAVYQFLIMFIIPVVVLFFCYLFVINALWLSSLQLRQMTAHNVTSYATVVTSTIEEPHNNGAHDGEPSPSTGNASPGGATGGHHSSSRFRSRRCMVTRATREHSAEVFRARKQVIKMLITIVLVFLLCWGPKLLFGIIGRIGVSWFYTPWAHKTKIVVSLLPFVHSCLNPIIYGFMSKSFRTRMQCACRAYVCRRTHPSVLIGKRPLAGSDYELDVRSTNGTIHTKISLRQGSSSQSDT